MAKLRLFISVTVLVFTYLWWNKSEETKPKEPMTLKKNAIVERIPASTTNKKFKPAGIGKTLTANTELDAESLGHECFDNLATDAHPYLSTFLQKTVDDPSAPVGRWLYDKSSLIQPAPSPSASDYFLRGLAVAGLLAGRENPTPNLNLALELLVKAHEMDPFNAATIIYVAYLQKQLGQDVLGQENMDQIYAHNMKYNTYETETIQHLHKHIKKPNDVLNFFQLRAEMPTVDASQLKNFLRESNRLDLGYLMMENKLNQKDNQSIDPDGDILSYFAGLSLIREISIDEANKYPRAQDLLKESKSHPQYKLIDLKEIGKNCTLDKLQPLVDYFQKASK